MKWLVVLDALELLKSRTDTSLALIDKARSETIEVDTATIDKLFFEKKAAVRALDATGKEERRDLDDYDLIFMRKEPPYDMNFHYATQILSLTRTTVVNAPSALRDFNEKLIALPFSRYMPPTLVSSNLAEIERFAASHGEIVIKMLDSFQGKSVKRIASGDTASFSAYVAEEHHPVMVQKFLDTVYEGDKRVLMLGDHFLGAAMRRPRQGYHANFASSDALATELTEMEQEALDTIGPWLLEHGIHFSGIDFIGGYLTEINITCPTGIVQISELENRDLAAEMVAYFRSLAGGEA